MFLYESCNTLNPPFQLPILNSNLRRTLISTEAPSFGLVKVLFYNLKEYLLCVPKVQLILPLTQKRDIVTSYEGSITRGDWKYINNVFSYSHILLTQTICSFKFLKRQQIDQQGFECSRRLVVEILRSLGMKDLYIASLTADLW